MSNAEVQSRPDVRTHYRIRGATAEKKERAASPSVRPGIRATGDGRDCVCRIWPGRCVYPMARDLGRYGAGEVARQTDGIWGAFFRAVGGWGSLYSGACQLGGPTCDNNRLRGNGIMWDRR